MTMSRLLTNLILLYLFLQYTNALVDVSVDQTLLNSGFHRLLTTNVTLYGNLTSCHVMVEEKIPKNMFINTNETVVIDYNISLRSDQSIDTETIASSSNPYTLYIYLNQNVPLQTSSEFSSKYVYTLPVNVRYHDPRAGGGYREFRKQPVTLFARCPEELTLSSSVTVKLPCDPETARICKWTSLPFVQKHVLPTILIPVGNVDYHLIVFLSTHIVAYAGVVVVIYNLLSS